MNKYIFEGLSTKQANDIFHKYGVPNASSLSKAELKKVYYNLVKKYHSDKSNSDDNATKEINSAYDILSLNNDNVSYSDFYQDDYFSKKAKDAYKKNEVPIWNPDRRGNLNDDPQKPDINYYKKLAWLVSNQPETKPENVYSFYIWSGYPNFDLIVTVYTTPEYFGKVAEILADVTYNVKAIFVSGREKNKVYLVYHNNKIVSPPQEMTHNSFNFNPENDWSFMKHIQKTL